MEDAGEKMNTKEKEKLEELLSNFASAYINYYHEESDYSDEDKKKLDDAEDAIEKFYDSLKDAK